jgi:hypothetical protein
MILLVARLVSGDAARRKVVFTWSTFMNRRTFLSMAVLAACCLVLAPGPAAAQTVTLFTDLDEFELVAGKGQPCIDFEQRTAGEFFRVLDFSDILFHAEDDTATDLRLIGPDPSLGLESRMLLSNRPFDSLVAELTPGVVVFSADVLSWRSDLPFPPPGSSLIVLVESTAGSETFDVTLANDGPTFIGLITDSKDTLITRVSFINPEGQDRFVAVDNVCYGDIAIPDPGDPLLDCLADLSDAIEEGRADRSISSRVAPLLQNRVRAAEEAVEDDDLASAERSLRALRIVVRGFRGSRISPPRVRQLIGLIDECLDLLND